MFDEKLILPTSWQPDRMTFLDVLGIKNRGLGFQLFGDVYDCFFKYSIDLKSEYIKYYSVEYATLGEYIETVYGKSLSEGDLEKEHIYLAKRFPSIVDTAYEENVRDIVLNCLKRLEGGGEDQA